MGMRFPGMLRVRHLCTETLDTQVRASIAAAEARAIGNKRKTLTAVEL